MGVSVRRAEARDVPALYLMNEEFSEPGSTTMAQMVEELERNTQEITCVAELDGELVGYACGQLFRSICYSAPRAEIMELFVREEYRGKGVGKKMLLYLEYCFMELGVNDFQLHANAKNFAAQVLYRSCGYNYDIEFSYRRFIT